MNQKLLRAAKWVAYPLFYLFCLGLFGYLTFPYDRLKDRLIQEFARAEASRAPGPPRRLEIDHLTSYWFSGVEVEGARLILPADAASVAAARAKAADDEAKAPVKDTVVTIDEAHARLQLSPLLLGRLKVAFWASVFGGEVSGVLPVGAKSGAVEVELTDVDLSKVEPFVSTLGIPVRGAVSGTLDYEPVDGKFSKGNGSLAIKIAGVSVGDGKTKIAGQVALPEAKLGDLTIAADAKDGVLKLTSFGATGGDIELVGDGKVTVRERWEESAADLYARFKFADAYRDKNDLTRTLLGTPSSKAPALLDMADPRIKKAKRADGFYGWHIFGPLKKLKFDPSAADGPSAKPARGKGAEPVAAPPPRPGGAPPGKMASPFPLGTSKVKVVEPAAEPPTPAPTPEPAPEPVAAPEPVRIQPTQEVTVDPPDPAEEEAPEEPEQ